MNITIIGAGISGLATAYTLRKAGHPVQVVAEHFSPNLTSNRAAAFWFPFHIRNDERGGSWARISYETYTFLSNTKETGISFHKLLKVIGKQHAAAGAQEGWLGCMPGGSWQYVSPGKLPAGVVKAYDCKVPLIETQLFLPWLMDHLQTQQVRFTQQHINAFTDIKNADMIINCSGLGAKSLCNDEQLIPVRGQVGLLSPQAGLPIYLDNEKPCYIVPRRDAIIVGGTYETGVETEDTDEDTIIRLLGNAVEVMPQLAKSSYKGSWAGLRPYRDAVRVEHEAGTNIIHNYGHGGSGFTLAFGCAATVAALLSKI